jgi:hypothetical protein
VSPVSEPLNLWIPAIGAALAGAGLYGYAAFLTRRFDRRSREASSVPTSAQPAPKLHVEEAVSKTQRAYEKAREAALRQSAQAGSESETPPKS